MKNIDQILQELIDIEPSFAEHREEMRTLISELIAKKPDTRLDEAFVAGLRSRLLGQPTPSPFSNYFSYTPYLVGVLAVLIALPLGYRYLSTSGTGASGTAVFAMNQQIEHLQGNAYGTIQSQTSGQPGLDGSEVAHAAPSIAPTETSYAPQTNTDARDMAVSVASAPAPASVPVTKMAAGMGGGASSRMMYPVGPVTVYSYVYKGEPLDLSATEGDVYSRTAGQNSSGQIATQLRKFDFGLMNFGTFSDASVRTFELAENKPFGYIIDVSFTDGTININADYTQWPTLNGKSGDMQPLPVSAMPKDDQLISIAKQFLDAHGVNLSNYAEPVVQQYAEAKAADSATQYAPDQITIVYPLKISGEQVYENGAYPYGLQVGVSVRDKKVMSVYGLTSQTYTSSSYKLETDSDKILSILKKGGPNSWIPPQESGVETKNVDIEVGTPTKVLMHTYNYKDNQSQELFVPALMFPVTKAPAEDEYYPKNIIIPLVPELLNQAQTGPIPYDAVR